MVLSKEGTPTSNDYLLPKIEENELEKVYKN